MHVKGKKLYEYTRKGIEVELPVRPAEVFDIQLVAFDQVGPDHPVATLEIHCASGTYIRSIAHALGQTLGCGAYLSKLIRTAHGKFESDASISLSTFLEAEHPEAYLLNPMAYLPFPQLVISEESTAKIRHGMKLLPPELPEKVFNDRLYLLLHDDMPVAVAYGEDTGRLKPVKVFS